MSEQRSTSGVATRMPTKLNLVHLRRHICYYYGFQFVLRLRLSSGVIANFNTCFRFILFYFHFSSEYAKITNGNGTDVLYHRGCAPFATENLMDVQFGRSTNISIQTYLGSLQSSVKVKFGILKKDISSGK